MDSKRLAYAPRAVRDLQGMDGKRGHQVLDDLELLAGGNLPATKVRKLRGMDFMELKAGDCRAIFRKEGDRIVVVRVVNRKDLERAIGSINPAALRAWLRGPGGVRR